MTPRVGRREWDSNPATIFAGLYHLNIPNDYRISIKGMGFEPITAVHGNYDLYSSHL